MAKQYTSSKDSYSPYLLHQAEHYVKQRIQLDHPLPRSYFYHVTLTGRDDLGNLTYDVIMSLSICEDRPNTRPIATKEARYRQDMYNSPGSRMDAYTQIQLMVDNLRREVTQDLDAYIVLLPKVEPRESKGSRLYRTGV